MNYQIDQKINQNTLTMFLSLFGLGCAKYLSLSYTIWILCLMTSCISILSVFICLIAYTYCYCILKYKKPKETRKQSNQNGIK